MRYRPGLGVVVFAAPAFLLLGACEPASVDEKEPLAASTQTGASSPTAPRRSPAEAPVEVRYRLLATPQVGQPVEIEVSVMPLVDAASVEFQLRPDDGVRIAPNMQKFTFAAAIARESRSQIVSVIPQREGRFYINVDASIVVNGEVITRVVMIPIQVGTGGPELERMGETTTDAEGNLIISLPAN